MGRGEPSKAFYFKVPFLSYFQLMNVIMANFCTLIDVVMVLSTVLMVLMKFNAIVSWFL